MLSLLLVLFEGSFIGIEIVELNVHQVREGEEKNQANKHDTPRHSVLYVLKEDCVLDLAKPRVVGAATIQAIEVFFYEDHVNGKYVDQVE